MHFIDHTLKWCHGEIFEGKILILYAVGLILVSLSFWKFGETPYAKAMVLPLLLVGVLYASVGGTLLITNPKRIVEYQNAYQNDPTAFIKSEMNRTEKFVSWYPQTLWVLVAVGIVAMISYGLTLRPLPNAISLAVLLLCFSGFMVDHFSKERAFTYVKELRAEAERLDIK